MTSTIKTGLKFKRGTSDGNVGKVYAFVTKENGHWRGCREDDDRKKKIVFADQSVSKSIIEGKLYWCKLIPMREDNGFIAMSAEMAKFKARIETIVKGKSFMVIVSFGNKKVVYDPTSSDEKRADIKGITDYLRHRVDLLDAQQVAEDFLDSACIVRGLYQRSNVH